MIVAGGNSAGPARDLWIFGYGSLMWKPGFPHDRAARARLSGYRRCFSVYSTHHRGSSDRPGLVLGLDRGGACEGIAFHVPPSQSAETLAYLRQREQINGVYREALVAVLLPDDGHIVVTARAYIVERAHPSYARPLPIRMQAQLIRAARGVSGCNLDYLINTLRHLRSLGIREPELERIATLAGPHFGRIGCTETTSSGAKALRAICQSQCAAAPVMRPAERRRFVHRRQLAALAERALSRTAPVEGETMP